MLTCTEALASPIMMQIVRVESGGNPFAIGVVGNQLERQPKNVEEAVATVKSLTAAGWNFSIGRGQVNKIHFARLGWLTDISKGFDVCENMTAAASIYDDCLARAVKAGYSKVVSSVGSEDVVKGYDSVRAALSCYYSGSFTRGEKLGYVAKVLNEKQQGSGFTKTALARSSMSMMVE